MKTLVKIEFDNDIAHLFSEEMYVVDIQSSHHRYMVFWTGIPLGGDQNAHANEIMDGLCNHELSSDMSRILVQKGREPEDFLQFFPNGFIIHEGKRIQKDKYKAQIIKEGALYRVQSLYGSSARGIEQENRSSKYLHSGHSCVVIEPQFKNAYVWRGKFSDENEFNHAKTFVKALGKHIGKLEEITEGNETDEFWNSIGGQSDYE